MTEKEIRFCLVSVLTNPGGGGKTVREYKYLEFILGKSYSYDYTI